MAGLGASQKRLYIKRPSGKVFGPFERNSIKTMLTANKLSREATFSPDKVTWKSLDMFPEFAEFYVPTSQDPKITHMGGWPSSAPVLETKPEAPSNLAIPKTNLKPSRPPGLPPRLPTPKLPSGLPAKLQDNLPQKAGFPNLPKRMNGFPDLPGVVSDLPGVASELPGVASELPAPASGLPVPMSSLPLLKGKDLPTPFGQELPVPVGSLPTPFGQELPVNFEVDNIDLPAVPGTPGGTLNSGLLPLSDDDLFGRDDDDDDLFKPESSLALDVSSEVSLFGKEDSDVSEDLFARSDPEEELEIQRNDDFLADGDNFSFLEEGGDEKSDGWGEGLFGEKSEAQPNESDHVSDAFDDWGDDLLAQDRHSSSVAEKSFSEVLPADDPMRPKSRGIDSQSASAGNAKDSKESSKDDDKKRGMLSFIAIFAALVIVGAVGWVVYTQFFKEAVITTKKVVKTKVKKVDVALDSIKSDNFDMLSKVTESANSAKIVADKRGELLLTQSLFLSRYDDEKTFASAQKLSSTLDSASTDFEKLGRGAFDAVQGNEAAALTYVSDLSDKDGAVGFYANALIGIANIKSIQNEMAKEPQTKKTGVLKDEKKTDAPKEEKAKEEQKEKNEKTEENNKKENDQPTTTQPVSEDPEDRFASRKDRAIGALKVASKLDTVSPLPGYWSGRLHELMKQPKLAKKAYDRKSNATHVASLLNSGKIAVELGDLNGAIKRLEKINAELTKAASPGELASSHHFAGLVQSGRNKSELAIENFVKALSFDPSRADTLQKLAEEYERAKKFKEALNFFTTNKNLGKKNPDVMLGIVRSHIGLEQWTSAIAQLEEGQKQFPEDARFPSTLGQLYLKRGNFFDAQKPLERAVEIDPTLLDSHAMLAQLAWKMDKDIGKGETHIEKIVALPDFITAKIAAQVAEYYRMSQRRDIAHAWFRASLKEDPNYWPARIAHARLLLEERRHEEARTLLEKARKEGVSDVRLSAYLADAYRQSKDYDRAIDEINKVIAQFPNNEEYAFILGMIEFDRGNFETARKHFNHAYEINPKYHRAYFYVGRTLFASNKSESALRIFRHVLDNEPNKGEYRFFMARALENAKRTTQALDEYRKATAIDKTYGIENPSLYVYRGKLLSRLGYNVEGKLDIARALELDPDNGKALIAMANVNYNEKDYVASIKNYTQALKDNPDQASAQAQLGMSYLYTDKLRNAATHLQLAVKYGYENSDVYKDLGYLYKDLGQRSLAKKSFKKFLDITKDDKIPAATKREVLEQIKGLK